jgi:hypothetical protein
MKASWPIFSTAKKLWLSENERPRMKSKTTIYAAMTGGFGSLAQVLPALGQLDPRRYRIVCSIHHSAAVAAKQLGYEVIPYPAVEPPAFVTPKGRDWCDLDQYWGRFGFADEKYFSRVVSSRLQLIDRIKPDLLLTQFCPPTEVIARITGLPLICFTQSCWHPRGRSITWWKNISSDHHLVTPAVNSVLRQHHCAPIARMEELNSGDITILPSFPEFDPVDDPDVLYTGLMQWSSAETITPLPQKISALDPERTICVYTGHLFDSAGKSGLLILEAVAEAIAGTPYTAVVTTGLGQEPVSGIPHLPNLLVFDWLPLQKMLDRSSLFIHHGGHGSCMAGISAGIPSLVIPTFQEREFNARQLHELGAGDFILPEELTTETLRRKIEDCISNRSIRQNVKQLQQLNLNRNYGGSAAAAQAIRNLAKAYFQH